MQTTGNSDSTLMTAAPSDRFAELAAEFGDADLADEAPEPDAGGSLVTEAS